MLNQQELENWANTKEIKWTEGLTIRPQKFIRTVVGRRTNTVDGAGSAVDAAGDHDEEEDGETMKDEELKKQIVAKVKNKKSAKMLPETRTLMPQVTGVRCPCRPTSERN